MRWRQWNAEAGCEVGEHRVTPSTLVPDIRPICARTHTRLFAAGEDYAAAQRELSASCSTCAWNAAFCPEGMGCAFGSAIVSDSFAHCRRETRNAGAAGGQPVMPK